MRRALVVLLVALVVPLGAGAVEEIRDPASVTPGTRGWCLTEMTGGEVVRVPITVLGYQGPTTPEGESVLVRLDDPRFKETGILAGMSGSPVYIDGKLLGALAIGWPFAREPIAGVTPFVRMLPLAGGGAHQDIMGPRPQMAELAAALAAGHLDRTVLDWLVPDGGRRNGLTPLPVFVSGASPAAVGWIGEAWQRLGWAAGPPAGRSETPSSPVVPGAMIAAVLVDGDAVVGAGGTVTEVRGDQVWAFGHPFLGGGSLGIPLARARVTAVLPSLSSSFKFFTVGDIVGSLEVDRSHGVWGRLGAPAPMLPITVEASGRTYSFRVPRHAVLLPLLAAYVTQASENARGRTLGDQTLKVKLAVQYANGASLEFSQMLTGSDASAQGAALVAAVLGYLNASPFSPPSMKSVAVVLVQDETQHRAEIIDAVPDRTVVRPGERLGVRVRMRTYREGLLERRAELEIPDYLPAGKLDLVVADGGSWSAYDLRARPFRPVSFADELRLIGRLLPSSSLVLALERRDTGVALGGGSVAAPPSIVLSLKSGLGPNVSMVPYRVAARRVAKLGMPLSGAVRVSLEVRTDGRGGADGAKAEDR